MSAYGVCGDVSVRRGYVGWVFISLTDLDLKLNCLFACWLLNVQATA